MQKVAACFGPAVWVIQAVVVDHFTCEHSREVQGSNEHATVLASRQHIKLLFRYGQNIVYCACKGGVIGSEAREPVSNGQTCIQDVQMVPSAFSWWSAPLNTAMPPEFLVESTHKYGDSVRNCSGSGHQGLSEE
jgi:hypothetical protein